MKPATLRQAEKILKLFEDTPSEQLQGLLASGLLADLRDGIALPDRNEFRRLCGLDPVKQQDWRVWMTLTIGGVSKEELLARLKENGCYVTPWAQDIMRESVFTTAAESCQILLVLVKVRDLGFIKSPTTTQLFARAEQGKLNRCPAETGPHLRLALAKQCGHYRVASEPIAHSGGDPFISNGEPFIFGVSPSDGGMQCLSALCAGPSYTWDLREQFVFQLGK